MKQISWLSIGLALAVFGMGSAYAKKEGSEAHRKQTVSDHRAMAKAHETAAACVEKATDEKAEKACHAQLATTCKEFAIGKYCGMKHRH
jgi:hypothetical protein